MTWPLATTPVVLAKAPRAGGPPLATTAFGLQLLPPKELLLLIRESGLLPNGSRISHICIMGIGGTIGCILVAIAAAGPASSVRPLEPRPGAAFGYGESQPLITLRWEDSQPSMLYVLQISRKSREGNVVATYEIHGRKSFAFKPDACGRYSWWVTGLGTGGKSGRPSKIRTFKVFLPSPVPIAPKEGQKLVAAKDRSRVEFSWSKRPVAGYRFELARDRGFRHKAKSLIVTRASISTSIAPEGKYYWRVRGTRPGTAWSRVRSFRVGSTGSKVGVSSTNGEVQKPKENSNTAVVKNGISKKPEQSAADEFPAAPKLQAPRDAARITSVKPRTITLFWNEIGGATAYEVEIAKTAEFSKVSSRRKVNSPVLGLPDPPRGRLFWRVRAVNAAGKSGNWSAARQFDYQVQPLWKN